MKAKTTYQLFKHRKFLLPAAVVLVAVVVWVLLGR